MASEKVHLRRCASPSSLRRTTQVRLTPQVLRAWHLELFTKPSLWRLFTRPSKLDYHNPDGFGKSLPQGGIPRPVPRNAGELFTQPSFWRLFMSPSPFTTHCFRCYACGRS
ncbi:MAG: hypothetical protein NTY64_09565 [Deltaproteobacteria bacterium]|nr:hypothetical protein [Deltaproteobacteria bacterium]